MSNAITTKHSLNFEVAESKYNVFDKGGHMLFRVGTCEGQWGCTKDSYFILSVINKQPGNGHLEDVFQWFEFSAKRDNRNLLVLECMNKEFYKHLTTKRGFIKLDEEKENCIKVFNEKKYKMLLRHGNEILQKGKLNCV